MGINVSGKDYLCIETGPCGRIQCKIRSQSEFEIAVWGVEMFIVLKNFKTRLAVVLVKHMPNFGVMNKH